MLLLAATTDKLQLVTSVAADVDVHVSYVDASNTTLVPSGGGKQNTAITTASTTDILAVPGANTLRNVKTINIRNKDTVDTTDVAVVFNQNATLFELFKATLKAGETLNYVEGVGWFTYQSSRLDRWLRVASNVVNATTSFADVTGLTCPVENGKTYCFEAHLYHTNDATTTGSRFGINGPTLSNIRVGVIDTVTNSVSASAHAAGALGTAVDTSPDGPTTTGSTAARLGIMSGSFQAGGPGTFAIRCQSEVAVASGLTVLAGSWGHVWEPTG